MHPAEAPAGPGLIKYLTTGPSAASVATLSRAQLLAAPPSSGCGAWGGAQMRRLRVGCQAVDACWERACRERGPGVDCPAGLLPLLLLGPCACAQR
jgi:hypothetical protein